MRTVIEARLEDNAGGRVPLRLAEFDQADGELKQLRLSLAEGKNLVYEAQRALINAQAHGFVAASIHCLQGGAALSIKAKHTIRYRTVFGKMTIDSPQLRVCKCSQDTGSKSFSPLAAVLPGRLSPELEYLQVKWAAHLPYAVAIALLKETLPVDQAIPVSGLRNCVWAVGQELHDATERTIRGERAYPPPNSKVKIVALAVDSAWLRHRLSPEEQDEAKLAKYFPLKRLPPTGRHINIIAGRAVRDDGSCKVYGYVNREVTSAATRLDHFLSEQGAAQDQKITIVSDGAGEFEKAVDGSQRPLTRILDWFHIAMKFRAIEQSAQKFPHGRPIFVGLPVPGTQIKICDFDTHAVLPAGEEGEIVVRTPSLFKGYWGQPELNAEVFRDGWFHTGDIGAYDAEGYLHFLGRRKEMLKVRGMSVFPSELEVLLSRHPAVLEAAVLGRPDPDKGQVPVAFLRLRPERENSVTADALQAWCREHMAVYKVPEIRLVAALPMTATGKVRKVELQAQLDASHQG